jgi:ABC-type antimicrobial peptide transport system permease subunit
VVGIAQNAHGFSVVEDPSAVIYVPLAQSPERSSANSPATEGLVVRTAGDPDPVMRVLRHAVGDTFPVSRRPVDLMADELAPQYRPWQLGAQLFAGFAVVALLVASLGLYSVLSYTVTMRRHELGVRLALGAQHAALMRLVMWDSLRHIAWGVGAGILIVLGGAGLLATQLYEISPRDPFVIVAAAAVLLLSASLAAIGPAWRAVRTDPMVAMRGE